MSKKNTVKLAYGCYGTVELFEALSNLNVLEGDIEDCKRRKDSIEASGYDVSETIKELEKLQDKFGEAWLAFVGIGAYSKSVTDVFGYTETVTGNVLAEAGQELVDGGHMTATAAARLCIKYGLVKGDGEIIASVASKFADFWNTKQSGYRISKKVVTVNRKTGDKHTKTNTVKSTGINKVSAFVAEFRSFLWQAITENKHFSVDAEGRLSVPDWAITDGCYDMNAKKPE